jgi:hypothetical protein
MAIHLGAVPAGSTIYIPFASYDAAGASATLSGLATTDIELYKNGSATPRASDNGYALLDTDGIDFNSKTGINGFSVDLNDNSDAGFYVVGGFYWVVVASVTIATQTVNLVAATFTITDAIDLSDVQSHLTKVYSDTTHIHSDTTTIQSDVTTLASDLAEGDFSDILSRLTVTNSNVLIIKSDVSDVLSRAVVINSETTDIQSETEVIQSQAVAIRAIVSDIQSDTNVMVPIVSDIQSDTNVLITKMRGVVVATGTIGATGNTTTALHLDNAVFDTLSDDELNGYLLVLYDNSADEYHTRTILDWTDTGDLATVATLPFTPEASVDLYWVMPPMSSHNAELSGTVSDVRSMLTKVYSDTTHIVSDTTTLASDLAEGDFSDILSRLTVTNSNVLIIKSDVSDVLSDLVKFEGAGGILSDINSGVNAIQAAGAALTAAQDSKLTQIHSDTQPVGTLFEIVSDIYSDTTAIEAGGGALTATQASQLARVQSIAIVIEPYTSDTVSMVTVVKSDTSDIISTLVKVYSDTAAIDSNVDKVYSDTTKIDTQTLDIQSETEVIQSLAVVIEAYVSDTYSDTTAIHSDTNLATPALIADAVWDEATSGHVTAGTFGQTLYIARANTAAGNGGGTATIELDASASATNDFYNGHMIVLTGGTGLSQAKFITDYVGATKIATVAEDWLTAPDATSVFVIIPFPNSEGGDISDVLSRLTVTNSQVLIIKSDTSDIKSHLTAIATVTSDIQSDTNLLITRIGEGDWSDVLSRLTVTNSQLVVVKSDVAHTESDAARVESKAVQIYSDTTIIASDAAQLTFTQAGVVDANIQYVNDVAVTGTGANGDEWGPV